MNIVEVICEAWRAKKPELLNDVLADSFVWQETPYDKPISKKAELLKMWQNDLKDQSDIRVSSEEVVVHDNVIVANWRAAFKRYDKSMEMDGVFIIKINHTGKLVEFKQWWVTK